MTISLVPISAENDDKRRVAAALAIFLINEGVDESMALPVAINIMGMFQKAIDANDISVIETEVSKQAIEYNAWVKRYYPELRTKRIP